MALARSAELPDPPDSVGASVDPRRDDTRLVARIRLGDERAFEELFRAYYPALCAYADRLVGGRANNEEIVQDAFLKIWRRRGTWELTGAIGPYLYRCVRNHAFSTLRHEVVEVRWRDEVKQGGPDPSTRRSTASDEADADLREAELTAAVEHAVGQLPARQREAYLLRRQSLSYADIAQIMGTTTKTVEVQIGNALRTLREKLADWLEP